MMTRTTFLHTTQTDLKLLTAADATVTHHWFNNHELTRFLSRGAWPLTEAAAVSYYQTAEDTHHRLILGIWHRNTDSLIGTVGLHAIDPINQTAELGIVIGTSKRHSQGVGTEVITALCGHAFSWLNLRSVTLRVLGNNPRALRCYHKCGFLETGRYPNHIFKDGVWVDEIFMLLRRKRVISVFEAGVA
jgi:RimJ/RimL family protein N-acetyltransferase